MYTDIRASACNEHVYMVRAHVDVHVQTAHVGVDVDVAYSDVDVVPGTI